MILDTKIQHLPICIRNPVMRTLEYDTPLWLSCSFLALTLSTFSDGITIMKNNKIVGFFGGKSLLEFVLQNPTSFALKEKVVQDLPIQVNLAIFSSGNTLRDLFVEWKKSGFAYSVIQDGDLHYLISVNSMLRFIELFDLPNTIAEIPKKTTVTYNNDDTIKTVLDKMFQHKVRRILHEGSTDVLSDRIIIDAICNEFDFFRNTPDFLSIKAKSLHAKKASELKLESKITDVARNMLKEDNYAAILNGQMISPWDIIFKFFEIMDK